MEDTARTMADGGVFQERATAGRADDVNSVPARTLPVPERRVEPRVSTARIWWPTKVIAIAMLLVGIAAPFGTTILGVVAISDIRHSQGRLIGLPLAVFDALFYPLLLLDGVLIAAVGILFSLVMALVFGRILNVGGTLSFAVSSLLVFMLAVPPCLLIDFLIVRAVWKQNAGALKS